MKNKIKLVVAVLVVLLLASLCFLLARGVLGLLNRGDLDLPEPDPMFAEQTVAPTRPPELYAEEAPKQHSTLDDYVPDEETPVDKTAEELIREAQSQA